MTERKREKKAALLFVLCMAVSGCTAGQTA